MRWWGWIVLFLIILWVAKHPVEASNFVHSMGDFFSSLVSS